MNWLHFGLGIVVTALQASIKNPRSLEKEYHVLSQIRDLIDQIMPPAPVLPVREPPASAV